MDKIGRQLSCLLDCLARIPWWAWFLLVIGGALLGIIALIVTVVTGGAGAIAMVPILIAAVKGALGAIGTTVGYCFMDCLKKVNG